MHAKRGSGFAFSQQAYDSISAVYQKALVSHHDHAKIVLNRLTSTLLEPHSRILDVGCGTGKPVAAHFVDNGHDVTGIDHSTKMLSLARSNVPNAEFLQVDLTSWEPSESGSYDLAIASHCLYNLSVAQIRSLVYKLSRWVKMGGIVVIGMSYNQGTLDSRGAQFDNRGWAEGFCNTFLEHDFIDATFGREDAWVDLIKSTGLEIVDIDRTLCLKANSHNPDVQFYITSKRVQENPFIGPFPIPQVYSGPLKFQLDAWDELRENSGVDKVKEAVFKALLQRPACSKVLSVIGPRSTASFEIGKESNIEIHQTSTSELLSPNVQLGSFDGVILNGVFHFVPSPEDYLDYAIQAIIPTAPAKIIVIESAPDNELTNMANDAFQGLDLPRLHGGYLLRIAERKCRAAGFQRIEYSYTQSSVDFDAVQGEERIASTANLLSRMWTDEATIQVQLEERFQKLLEVQFLFKSNGEIATPIVILVAERI